MKIEIGQEVTVGNNARRGISKYKAVVKTVGRKWFTVNTEEWEFIGKEHKFSLEDGACDGKGYMSEYKVFLSEEDYENSKKKPLLLRDIQSRLHILDYDILLEIKEKYL